MGKYSIENTKHEKSEKKWVEQQPKRKNSSLGEHLTVENDNWPISEPPTSKVYLEKTMARNVTKHQTSIW